MRLIESPFAGKSRLSRQHPAIITKDRSYRFEAYAKTVRSASLILERIGVKSGARIGLIADTSVECVVALGALLQLGAVACPVNPRFPDKILASYLRKLGCGSVLSNGRRELDGISVELIPLESLMSGSEEANHEQLDLDNDAMIIATSGSSGEPKAAVLTLGNLYYNALGSNANIPLCESDSWLLSLPLYHVGGIGILYRALVAGAAVILPERGQSLLESIKINRPSHFSLVHTQLFRLLKIDDLADTLSDCKAILLGGSAFPSSLLKTAFEAGLPIHTSYGLTEMASQVCSTAPNASLDHLLTSGQLLEYRELMISPQGEILVRGETRFHGYVDADGLTEPFDKAGWFATGDTGRMDAEGNLVVEGRRDNQFISGGENIHPEEIEAAFYTLPEIEEVIVVPIDDPEYGQRPVAFVRRSDGKSSEQVDYNADLREILPGFKLPVAIYPWPTGLLAGNLKASRGYLTERARDLKSLS